MHQGVTRWCMGSLELHGQGPQAALASSSEGLAILEESAVEVEADIGLQAVRETFQHLDEGHLFIIRQLYLALSSLLGSSGGLMTL